VGAVAAVAAVAVWLLLPTPAGYDAVFHLVWGRELLEGTAPSFTAYAAPTPHPLLLAAAVPLGLLGGGADRALVLLCLLAHAALVAGTFRLGRAIFGPWPGLVAALVVAVSPTLLLYAARGYPDVPFVALVVWAGALEAERGATGPRRRAAAPMALLVLAGLLRPEAWLLAGLYAVWLGRRAGLAARAALAAAVLAPPAVWAGMDLAATGDPLHSLHATSALADVLGREQGLAAAPGAFARAVAATIGPPAALLAVLGAWLAVRRHGWAPLRVPVVLVAAGVGSFAAVALLGLSILPRYLTVPSVAASPFAGYALAGFASLAAAAPARRTWRRLSLAAAAVGLAGLALAAPSPAAIRAELRLLRDTRASLVALLDRPAVRAALRCGPLTFPTYRLVPDARWHLRAGVDEVGARSERRRRHGVAVFALGQATLRRFGFADGASALTNVPDPGLVPVARTRHFAAYASCP